MAHSIFAVQRKVGIILDSVQRIIHLLKDNCMDTVTRRYGAILFGNLAMDVDFSSHIITWNGISTLISMLHQFAILGTKIWT